MILPTSRWIDIQHLSCIFYLLSSSSSSRPNQTTPSAPPAPASHGWLRLRRPTVRTLQHWLVPPSIPPHVLLFSGDVSPNTHPHPNQSTLVLYAWASTTTSSSAPRHPLPRPRRRPPPWCSRRGMVNVVNDRLPSEEYCAWRR